MPDRCRDFVLLCIDTGADIEKPIRYMIRKCSEPKGRGLGAEKEPTVRYGRCSDGRGLPQTGKFKVAIFGGREDLCTTLQPGK